MFKKSDIVEALEKLSEREFKQLREGSWVVNAQHRRDIETARMKESWQEKRVIWKDDRVDNIVYSNFASPKYAVFIERASHTETRFQISPEQEARIREEIAGAFDRLLWGKILYPQSEPVLVTWQRRDGETVRAWSIRLFDGGMLDDPDIRWEYQKGVWLWPVELLRAIWRWWQSLDSPR